MHHEDTKQITKLIIEEWQKSQRETTSEPEPELTQKVTWPTDCTVGPGLEGAIACETKVGYVNGTKGWLVYRGYDIFELCAYSTFEEVSYLLLHGNLPTTEQLLVFKKKLAEYRLLPKTLRLLMSFPVQEMSTMAALRLGINLMRQKQTLRDSSSHHLSKVKVISSDEDSIPMETPPLGEKRAVFEFKDKDMNRPKPGKAAKDQEAARGLEACYHLIAGVSTITAAIARLRAGRLPLEPDPELGHAANLLYMMTGKRPTPTEERVMDIALILHADHGMNASTFATMVVASTLSDIYFSIGSGVAALNGSLHGGANEQVLRDLQEINNPENVSSWYEEARSHKRKIMGFGHRVYKAYDPRARILGPLAAYLTKRSKDADDKRLFSTAKALEKRVVADLGKKRGIFPNVDFYSGLVYKSMGIPVELFTPIFAVARVSGWSARTLEYLKTNRIFRPRAVYVGGFNRGYLPFEERDPM